jgi:hypothetical protein
MTSTGGFHLNDFETSIWSNFGEFENPETCAAPESQLWDVFAGRLDQATADDPFLE